MDKKIPRGGVGSGVPFIARPIFLLTGIHLSRNTMNMGCLRLDRGVRFFNINGPS